MKKYGILSIVIALSIGAVRAGVIYSNSFAGTAGTVGSATIPEVNEIIGYVDASSAQMVVDGNGHLYSSAKGALFNYRFRLDPTPLEQHSDLTAVKYTVAMQAPTNNWVGVGFAGNNGNGFLTSSINSGPWLKINPVSLQVEGGTVTGGSEDKYDNTHAAGQLITLEFTYHFDQTVDVALNGVSITNGSVITHIDDGGVTTNPVISWLQVNMYYQDTPANGGSYIDSLTVETISEPAMSGYADWAAGWGDDIGAETNDYDNDGLSNIYEYGLGGNPTNAADRGAPPVFGVTDIGGTNSFHYIHPQLSDTNSGLSYHIELNTDLISGSWTNAGYIVSGTNVTGGSLNYVTNITDMVADEKFIRLIIE